MILKVSTKQKMYNNLFVFLWRKKKLYWFITTDQLHAFVLNPSIYLFLYRYFIYTIFPLLHQSALTIQYSDNNLFIHVVNWIYSCSYFLREWIVIRFKMEHYHKIQNFSINIKLVIVPIIYLLLETAKIRGKEAK